MGTGTVNLYWSTDDPLYLSNDYPLTMYVWRYDPVSQTSQQIADGTKFWQWSDTGLTSGRTYRYYVEVRNAEGISWQTDRTYAIVS